MIQVFKDPASDRLALVYDDGDGGIFEVSPDFTELTECNEVPGDWAELTPRGR